MRKKCGGNEEPRNFPATRERNAMRVGVPTEIKNNENRVALTPAGVHELVRRGHDVVIQAGAGLGAQITDEAYVAAGATMLETAAEIWAAGDLLLKVKEPIAAEYPLMR